MSDHRVVRVAAVVASMLGALTLVLPWQHSGSCWTFWNRVECGWPYGQVDHHAGVGQLQWDAMDAVPMLALLAVMMSFVALVLVVASDDPREGWARVAALAAGALYPITGIVWVAASGDLGGGLLLMGGASVVSFVVARLLEAPVAGPPAADA